MSENMKDSLIDSYNKKAQERELDSVSDWKLTERERFLKMIQKENAKHFLEIGAGPGKDSLFFQQNGLDTFSTDISEKMVELCMQKGLKAEVMSFEALEVETNCFDAIWGLNCLLHLPKARLGLVLEELKRVLKPNGLFYLGVYGGRDSEGIWEEDFYEPKRFFSYFKDENLLSVVSEYFKVESFQVIPKSVIVGTLHFQACVLRKMDF